MDDERPRVEVVFTDDDFARMKITVTFVFLQFVLYLTRITSCNGVFSSLESVYHLLVRKC